MSKKQSKNDNNQEIQKIEATIREFLHEKKKMEEELLNELIQYVRDGTFPKDKTGSYMICYNIICNFADKHIGDYIINYHNDIIKNTSRECYNKIKNLSGIDFLDSFIDCTEKLNFLIYNMSRIFLYISNNYLKSAKDIIGNRIYEQDDMSEFSMDIYKDFFFQYLQNKLYIFLNEFLIRDERNGNNENRLKILSIMKIISYMDYKKPKIFKSGDTSIIWKETSTELPVQDLVYQKRWYNNYFKEETKRYLKIKSEIDIKTLSAPEYVKCELNYIKQEHEREFSYIHEVFHNDINDMNYDYLIVHNMNKLVEMDTGINNMFKTNKKDELSDIYKLFTYYPESLKLIQKSFREYIKERFQALHNDKELSKDSIQFAHALISLKKEMDELVSLCFENHTDFQDSENKEFSLLMSKEIYPKQLAGYVDFCMRNGFKGKSLEEIENILNDIISIFKNIDSKLIFKIESEKKMSERLIKNLFLSLNSEKLFISKLKQESGVTYVSIMNEMIDDFEKNKEEMDGYKLAKSRGMPNGIKFNVVVISQRAWNISKLDMEKIEVPKFIKYCMDDFESYYLNRHQQTKLIWCLGFSRLDIQYLYLKNKNISVSTLPQFLTLLILEKYSKLNLEKLSLFLGCNVNILINDIRGLLFNPSFNPKSEIDKGVILADIDPKSKEFKPTTEISLNLNFSVNHPRFITLPLPLKKTEAEIKQSEMEEAQIIKRYQDNILQVTVIRIMKSRIQQQTTHDWLVNEVAKQIDLFKAQPEQIKENIEKLIEKNIIKINGPLYEYVV